ncbi:MAG: ribosomal protein S18 acetylase RimI-like enzyme [Verrucomicrobiales bacterium]|jgi:ribosomal protein S18 acetylase RimI-like enzyme
MEIGWPGWRDRLFKPALTLRPARNSELDQLCDFYESCMRPYSEEFDPWNPDLFRSRFKADETEVLQVGIRFAGLLKTQVYETHVYLADVQLKPEIRNRGVGTKLVKLTLERASALDLPVQLRVLRNNPALTLYKRLGFRIIEEARTHFLFESVP